MIDPLASPFSDAFADFRQSVTASCFVCSPFITQAPVRALVKSFQERQIEDAVQVRVLTDISYMNLIQGSTDVEALLYLHDHLPNVQVSYLPRVHAKVFIADDALAIVGSANFTDGGTFRNYEYGLRVRETPLVQQIREDVTRYASLGGEATPGRLRELGQQIIPLREAAREAQRSLRQILPEPITRQQQAAEDNLIRIRVEGRTANAIFSDTLLYLLSRSPKTTAELNALIQQIHPDLCDDSTDRVIDGVHYGKKWKHQVRGAQVSLARQGHITRDKATGLWQKS
jgi:hypothetical protein